jgi:urease accessory protein UreE
MTLPALGDIVTWADTHFIVVGIITEPALVLEDANGYRTTVGASTVKVRHHNHNQEPNR